MTFFFSPLFNSISVSLCDNYNMSPFQKKERSIPDNSHIKREKKSEKCWVDIKKNHECTNKYTNKQKYSPIQKSPPSLHQQKSKQTNKQPPH